jgi:toxin ParE1/3/4
MKVRWTEPAVNQLHQVFANSAAAADRTVRKIREATIRAARMPYSGRTGRIVETREISVPGTSYLVGYKIIDRSFHVLAIFHGAQQWPETRRLRGTSNGSVA